MGCTSSRAAPSAVVQPGVKLGVHLGSKELELASVSDDRGGDHHSVTSKTEDLGSSSKGTLTAARQEHQEHSASDASHAYHQDPEASDPIHQKKETRGCSADGGSYRRNLHHRLEHGHGDPAITDGSRPRRGGAHHQVTRNRGTGQRRSTSPRRRSTSPRRRSKSPRSSILPANESRAGSDKMSHSHCTHSRRSAASIDNSSSMRRKRNAMIKDEEHHAEIRRDCSPNNNVTSMKVDTSKDIELDVSDLGASGSSLGFYNSISTLTSAGFTTDQSADHTHESRPRQRRGTPRKVRKDTEEDRDVSVPDRSSSKKSLDVSVSASNSKRSDHSRRSNHSRRSEKSKKSYKSSTTTTTTPAKKHEHKKPKRLFVERTGTSSSTMPTEIKSPDISSLSTSRQTASSKRSRKSKSNTTEGKPRVHRKHRTGRMTSSKAALTIPENEPRDGDSVNRHRNDDATSDGPLTPRLHSETPFQVAAGDDGEALKHTPEIIKALEVPSQHSLEVPSQHSLKSYLPVTMKGPSDDMATERAADSSQERSCTIGDSDGREGQPAHADTVKNTSQTVVDGDKSSRSIRSNGVLKDVLKQIKKIPHTGTNEKYAMTDDGSGDDDESLRSLDIFDKEPAQTKLEDPRIFQFDASNPGIAQFDPEAAHNSLSAFDDLQKEQISVTKEKQEAKAVQKMHASCSQLVAEEIPSSRKSYFKSRRSRGNRDET